MKEILQCFSTSKNIYFLMIIFSSPQAGGFNHPALHIKKFFIGGLKTLLNFRVLSNYILLLWSLLFFVVAKVLLLLRFKSPELPSSRFLDLSTRCRSSRAFFSFVLINYRSCRAYFIIKKENFSLVL